MAEQITIGATVRFRPGGKGEQAATVQAITRCPRRGDKFGTKVASISWTDREVAFLALDNGDYCYGYELV